MGGSKLNWAYHVVVYSVNVNLVSDNTHIIMRKQKLCKLLVRRFVQKKVLRKLAVCSCSVSRMVDKITT
jgi:hypothetical protein